MNGAPPAPPTIRPLTLGERWEEFAADAFPGSSPEDRFELQRLFYAAYLNCLLTIEELREANVPEAQALAVLDAHSGEATALLFGERSLT
jgi:hypothetical protein